ncbi:MAG: hypothetical protein M0C28_06970 [Candidatus Moduliflexus flocculans]|nr:hypothetical protein [Candidatus Moduliflexus flocculans]
MKATENRSSGSYRSGKSADLQDVVPGPGKNVLRVSHADLIEIGADGPERHPAAVYLRAARPDERIAEAGEATGEPGAFRAQDHPPGRGEFELLPLRERHARDLGPAHGPGYAGDGKDEQRQAQTEDRARDPRTAPGKRAQERHAGLRPPPPARRVTSAGPSCS